MNSPFQTIFKDCVREWAILPARQKSGLSRIYAHFCVSWDRRRKKSIGGDNQIFDEILSTIGSWTVALATIEDFSILIND
ncbi:MAG TPA: hypothetical protein VMV49_13715 [Candidatus Deferrimicrobium sp.]|nr:hypothetical protein [Candidatus Deferrimicrobium sp.]